MIINIVITCLAACVALGVHLLFDLHKQETKKPILHWFSALIVAAISVVFGCVDQVFSSGAHNWKQFTIFSLLVHLALFDPIWNKVHGERWNYHGTPNNPDRAITDKAWEQIPGAGEIFFRVIFLTLGVLVYYSWDRIIQGGWLGNS